MCLRSAVYGMGVTVRSHRTVPTFHRPLKQTVTAFRHLSALSHTESEKTEKTEKTEEKGTPRSPVWGEGPGLVAAAVVAQTGFWAADHLGAALLAAQNVTSHTSPIVRCWS